MAETPGPDPGTLPAIPQPTASELGSVTFEWQPRHVVMHPVLDSELDTFDGTSTGLPLTFFGLSAGGALTAIATLTQSLSTDAHAGFIALLILGVVMMLFFGITSIVRWVQRRKLLRRIRQRPPVPGAAPQ